MGFLDSIKGALSPANNDNNEIQHRGRKQEKKPGFLSGLLNPPNAKGGKPEQQSASDDENHIMSLLNSSSDDGSTQDEDYESILNDEIKPHGPSEILELLDIADNYEVPNNVLLVGDLDRVRFDITTPKGYDIKMVEDFFDSVHTSIAWYVEKLQQRNNDIRKMEDMLNKQGTDLHNAKVAQAMSDPDFTVITGEESTAEQDLKEAQLRIVRLQEENDKLKKIIKSHGNSPEMDSETQSKYDELQNQLALSQMEVKKLTSQLKRQTLRNNTAFEDDMGFIDDLTPDSGTHVGLMDPDELSAMPDADGGAMPGVDDEIGGMPGADDGMSMPSLDDDATPARQPSKRKRPQRRAQQQASMPMDDGMGMPDVDDDTEYYAGYRQRHNSGNDMRAAAEADEDFDIDHSVNGLRGNNPSISPFRKKANNGGGVNSNPFGSNDDVEIPLPDSMGSEDYDELDLFDDGQIDMSDFLYDDE